MSKQRRASFWSMTGRASSKPQRQALISDDSQPQPQLELCQTARCSIPIHIATVEWKKRFQERKASEK